MSDNLWDGFGLIDEPAPVAPTSVTNAPGLDGPEDILARIEKDAGVKLGPVERAQALNQIRNGDYNIRIPKAKPAAGDDLWAGFGLVDESQPQPTPAVVLPTKAEEEPGFFANASAAVDRVLSLGGAAIDAVQGTAETALGQAYRYIAEEGSTGRGGQPVVGPASAENFTAASIPLRQAGKANQAAVQSYRDEHGLGQGFSGGAEGIALDVAANPDMALTSVASLVPVVGTALASQLAGVPAGRVFLNEYYSMLDQGVPKDEARTRALAMAGIEYGAEITPGGKFLKGGKAVTSSATKIGKTSLEEFVQESATEAAQGGLDTLLGSSDIGSKELQEATKKQGFSDTEDFVKRVAYAGTVGSVAAGGMRSSTAWLETAAEIGHQTAKVKAAVNENLAKEKNKADKTDFNIDQDLQFEAERIRKEKEKEDAFKQAEQERATREAEEARQKEIEQEAGFRTLDVEASVKGQTRLDKYGPGNLESVPINPPAEVTPEAVQAEREQAKEAEAARVERVEVGNLTEQLRKRQVVAEGKVKAEEKKAQAKERARKRSIMDQLIKDNPGVAPVDLVPKLREALGAPVAPSTPTRGRSATPTAPKPVVPDGKLDSKRTKDLLATLGIDEDTDTESVAQKAGGQGDVSQPFSKRAETAIKALVSKTNQTSADVQNLLLQGKLILAPNPAYLHKDDLGGEAEYDVKDGKMYLYLDRVDPKDVGFTIMSALHEATHAGQFNNREGRSDLMQQIMGAKANNAKRLIADAARKGNKLANRAVELASEASPNTTIQDLELLPYFVGEAARSRQGFGQLGGLVKDIKVAAKDFARQKLGVNFEFTLDDINSAAQKVAGEVAKTDLKGDERGVKALAMVGGKNATGWQEAVRDKANYKGRVDQQERFEFSDEGATIDQQQLAKLNNVAYLPLGNVLNHPELYKQYPKLATKIKVKIDPELKDGKLGYVNGDTIALHPSYVNGGKTTDELMDTLLHEVQHTIQAIEGFVPGSSSRYFLPKQVANNRNFAERNYQRALRRFDIEKALANMPAAARNQWLSVESKRNGRDSVEGDNLTSEEAMKERFVHNGYVEFVKNDDVQDQAKAINEALSNYQNAKEEFRKANDVAYSTYQADYGEAEARTTSLRKNMTLEARRKVPLESTMRLTGVPVENTIDSTKYLRDSGQLAAYNEEASLAQRRKRGEDKSRKYNKWLPVWVAGLIDSSAFSGRAAREIMEAAAASPARDRMIAEGTVHKYRQSVARLAAERGMTADALNKQIMKELDAIDKDSDDYETNLAAFTAVAKKYGAAGEALLDFRNQADALSEQMVLARAKQGTPLSPEEKKFYKTLISNMGRYAHRQYAVHMGKGGKQYTETIWKAYKKDELKTPADRENAARVANAVKRIIDDQLVIPEDEDLQDASADRILSLFTTWAGSTDPKAYTREQMEEALADIRDAVNGNADLMKATAESIVQEILDLKTATSPTAKYYRGAKVDKGIMKERTGIPPEVRELMGEIKDPAMQLFTTVAKQAEFIARHRMLLELRNLNDPQHVQPPGPAGREEVKDMVPLEGDTYGALQNHYVSKNLFSQLSDQIQQLATFEQAVAMAASRPDPLAALAATKAVKAWGKVAGTSKMLQIIYNPMNFLYNFMGGPRTLILNGNLNPSHIGKAVITASDIIRYARNPGHNTAEARRITAAGITDSAFIGEINSELYDELDKTLRAMQGKKPLEGLSKLKALGLTAKETYAMMDVVFKIANFYQQADAVLPQFYKAEGVEKTQDELDREAADIVNGTNVTYKRAAPFVRAAEKYGLSNFGTFFYEVFRSEVNNVRQGIEELQRAKDAKSDKGAAIMRAQGARRLLGQTAVWSATVAATSLLSSLVFGDDEDKNRKLRAMLPDYERSKDFIVIGHDDKGKPILFDVSRFDPAGPASDILRAGLHNDKPLDSLKDSIMQLYVAPRIGVKMFDALMVSAGKENSVSKPILQQLLPEAYDKLLNITDPTLKDRTTKAWTQVAETFLPGVVRSWRDSNARPVMEGPTTAVAAAMTYGGASMYSLEGKQQMKTLAYDYNDMVKDSRKQIKDIFTDHPTMTEKELVKRLGAIKEEEREAFDNLLGVYQGRLEAGESGRDMTVELKNASVPTAIIKDLKAGRFKFRSVSKKSIDSYRKKELSELKGAEKLEAKQKWKDVWELLRISNEEMEETN